MTVAIIISVCILLLIAYLFDLTSSRTRIPSVILLLLLGWSSRQLTDWLSLEMPDFFGILPVLGTIGLILIVLEGSLELEFNKTKFRLIRKSLLGAFLNLLILSFLMGLSFMYFGGFGLKESLLNAIPLCVISSAIAIPSVSNLSSRNKEFIIYESSLSDILGVIFFNFLALNTVINGYAFLDFSFQILLIVVISLVATVGLSFLLNKIEHHIKFVPIIILVILIYELSKVFHLPGLIFILIFGLAIGNLDELKQFKWIEKFNPDGLNREVVKFKELTTEGAFLVRAAFFLIFGFTIETEEVLNTDTLIWSVSITATIFILRAIQLTISKLPLKPLLFVAPRGLITILLFLSIEPDNQINLVNNSLIIQVVILTALVMMFGLIAGQSRSEKMANSDPK